MPLPDAVPTLASPRVIATASPRRRHLRLAAIVALLGVAAMLRIWLLAALPRFFGPGDPDTYFAMARSVVRSGVPRIDFVWNYTSLPGAISHVESYYEIAYAYLLGGALAMFGEHPVVGCALSVVFGVLASWRWSHGPSTTRAC